MSRHWRIADGIAWVGETDRVALIDTRSGTSSPMLVPPLFAELWRLLAASSQPEADLQAKGAELANESGPELVEGFLEAMTEYDLIESVASGI